MAWENNLVGSEKQVKWAKSIIEKSYSNVQDIMLEMGDFGIFKTTTFDSWAYEVTKQYPNSWDWINGKILFPR